MVLNMLFHEDDIEYRHKDSLADESGYLRIDTEVHNYTGENRMCVICICTLSVFENVSYTLFHNLAACIYIA